VFYVNGEDMCCSYYPDDYAYEPRGYSSSDCYSELSLLGILHETDKAYLLRNAKGSFWIPKAMCRRVRQDRAEVNIKFKIKLIKTRLSGGRKK
jgi:hypothetical protein